MFYMLRLQCQLAHQALQGHAIHIIARKINLRIPVALFFRQLVPIGFCRQIENYLIPQIGPADTDKHRRIYGIFP